MNQANTELPYAGDGLDAQAHGQDGLQMVTFALGKGRFAVLMHSVQEIVRVPDTVKVPLAPPCLAGLSNLRGKVLPMYLLRTMLGMDTLEVDDVARALVVHTQPPVGLVVDKVLSVKTIAKEDIEPASEVESQINVDWLSGMIRDEEGLVLLLNVESLLAANEVGASATKAKHEAHPQAHASDEEAHSDEIQLVSFEVAGQEYAAPIERVQEIVQAPSEWVTVPNTPAHVLGVMVLRQKLLPLVSLRSIFGLPFIELQENHRVVVLHVGAQAAVGVVMDLVHEVLRVPKSLIEPVPALFQDSGGKNHLSGMCRLEQGKRLVSILEVEGLFDRTSLESTLNFLQETRGVGQTDEMSLQDEDDSDDEEQTVVFKLGQEEFGVDIRSVQEIVRVPEQLVRIPQAPSFLEGVINLRGTVLPVVDQRRRMGIAASQASDRQRIMVYLVHGVRTGFIVDSVSEVLKIPKNTVTETPSGGQHTQSLIPRVANLPSSKRMILLIDPAALLKTEESKALVEPSAFESGASERAELPPFQLNEHLEQDPALLMH